MRLATIILFAAVLSPICQGQKFRFSQVRESTVQEREQNAPVSQREREERIKQLFIQAGCTHDKLSEQPLDHEAGTNVICRLPGKSKDVIIVGANYSHQDIDNWTGASLLPSLFESLNGRKRHHTFMFIAFADGHGNVAGSEFFAKQMSPADIERTEAMINLDALGFSPTKISSSGSDKKLVELFVTVMYVLKQMGSQVDLSRAMQMDSGPFAALRIPQITIHSLTHDVVTGLNEEPLVPIPEAEFAHSETGFRPDLYYNSYQLIGGYLAFLDEALKRRRHK